MSEYMASHLIGAKRREEYENSDGISARKNC